MNLINRIKCLLNYHKMPAEGWLIHNSDGVNNEIPNAAFKCENCHKYHLVWAVTVEE